MIIRDFNVEAMPVLQRYVSFSDSYSVKNLIKEPTCYKNPNKPFCIKHSCVIETGLSNFHRMTVTVMKATFE